MSHRIVTRILSLLFALTAVPLYAAEPFVQSFGWEDVRIADAKLKPAVAEIHPLNVLAFPEAKITETEGIGFPNEPNLSETLAYLTDGDCGKIGATGRVPVFGTPARIVFYLGRPVSVREIRVVSGNEDGRSNQDYEVRLANNAAHPGEKPDFSDAPVFSSGETVLGKDKGGFISIIKRGDGENLIDGEVDWVEFRVWRTCGAKAGSPAKEKSPAGDWGILSELEVLIDPETPGIFADLKVKNEWKLAYRVRDLQWRLGRPDPELAFALRNLDSLKRALDHFIGKYPDEFDPKDYQKRYDALILRLFAAKTDEELLSAADDYNVLRHNILLSNPLLGDFDQILARKTNQPSIQPNWISDAQRYKEGEQADSIVAFDPKDPNSEMTELVQGRNKRFIGDICLHWNADRFLVTTLSDQKTWQIFEYRFDDGSLRQVTPDMGGDVDNCNPCYVPDGSVLFVSSASMMGVPCIAGTGVVGNIYRLEPDGKTVRQLTFEQDQDWYPTILLNGRILYLRWEYIDTPHYFTRILFTMNPDGTNQIEHYGSGSYWPNSIFNARPLPGQSSKFVGVVSGHHGSVRQGEIVLFDPSLGRQEDQGVIQRIPGYGKKVEPVIADALIDRSWPRFFHPYPLSDEFFLASGMLEPDLWHWSLFLVDIFDNILTIRDDKKTGFDFFEPIPLMEQEEPEKIADRTVPGAKESNVFITDVYFGQGLPNVPRGIVKKLRVYAVSYGYRGIGGHDAYGMESCWDGRRILGEVPVFEDGSATFKIPANTPLVLQPLDENGAAVQLMRSWFVGMPGENVSCIGCHETQNSVSPVKPTIAQRKTPQAIEPFYGPERAFSFSGEIQPILDRYCVGCHDGSEMDRPNFADTTAGARGFSKSYHALHPFVRRPGPESDIHVFCPMEYHVSTSELIQMLDKGHHNVKLDAESLAKIYCWIDMNVPYFGTWTEIAAFQKDQKEADMIGDTADRYVELKSLYADNDVNYESDAYAFKKEKPVEFLPPEETPEPDRSAPSLAGWPMNADAAVALQRGVTDSGADNGLRSDNADTDNATGRPTQTVRLSDKVAFNLVKIPAGTFIMGDEDGFLDELPRRPVTIEKSFWMMTTEVTNALYALYDAGHDSRFVDVWLKDHSTPGFVANQPNQPVIRVSWEEATKFCEWLSGQTGRRFRLPTEAEWEWSARGGSDSPMWFGDLDADFGKSENLADHQTRLFASGESLSQSRNFEPWETFFPRNDSVDDGHYIECEVGRYAPNPFGLYDILGNVSEWTASDYRPYPYRTDDGRNGGDPSIKKVTRGGSWADRPKWGRSGIRKPYESWQKIHNVGFRVLCEE